MHPHRIMQRENKAFSTSPKRMGHLMHTMASDDPRKVRRENLLVQSLPLLILAYNLLIIRTLVSTPVVVVRTLVRVLPQLRSR